jgi:hypothetical protein
MTFNPNIPIGTNFLSVDYKNIQQNFAASDAVFGVNHLKFSNATAQKGYHTIVNFVNQSGDPAPTTGYGQLYTKTVNADQQLFYETGGGVVKQITPSFPMNAAVNFSWNGVSVVINSAYNVSPGGVTRTAKGFYTIAFTNAIPSFNYFYTMSAMGSTTTLIASPQFNAVYPGSMQTTQALVRFYDTNQSQDPVSATLMIFGG